MTPAEKDARAFVRFVNASADAWIKANNRGRDDDGYRFLMSVHRARGGDAEGIAKRYGFAIDWPGLYAALYRDDTGHFYATCERAAVARLFAKAGAL